MSRMQLLSLMISGAGPLLLAGCSISPSVWVDDAHTFELPAAGVQTASITTHNGNVTVEPEEAASLRVVAYVRAGGADDGDADACLAAVDVQVHVLGTELVASWDWLHEPRRSWEASVSFDVSVPEHCALVLRSQNGRLRVQDMAGRVDASTHNGSIDVLGCVGEWVLESHNGEITASGPVQKVNVRTHNGKLRLTLEGAGPVEGDAETYNGAIQLVVHPSVDARIHCESHNGEVSCGKAPFHDVQVQDGRFEGTLGSGSGELRLVTHNGDVSVREVEEDR